MINTFLNKLGLTDNERSIYLFLLENGQCMASMIGQRLNIKRVTVYAALESLSQKNLVTSLKRNNVAYFEAASGEKLVELCEERVREDMLLQQEAVGLLPELKSIEKKQTMQVVEVKGRVKYYQGIDAVKGLINETLDENSKEQLCFGLNEYHINHPVDDWKKYTHKRVSVGMHVKSIQPDTEDAREYKKRDKDELRKTYLVPHKKFPAHCELNIIGDMIALFTVHNNEPTGTKIYNKEMAQVLRSLFELAWERAEAYDKNSGEEKRIAEETCRII